MDKKELIEGLTRVIKSNDSKLSKKDLKTLKKLRKDLKASETTEEITSILLKLIKYFELVREVVVLLVDNFKEPPS